MATNGQSMKGQNGRILETIESLPEKLRLFITGNVEIWSLGIALAFYFSAVRVFITQVTGKLTDYFPTPILGLIGSLLFVAPLLGFVLKKYRKIRLLAPAIISVAKLGQALPFFAPRMAFNTVLLILVSGWVAYYVYYMLRTVEKSSVLLALGSGAIIDLSLRAPILGVDSGLTTNLFVIAMVAVLAGLFIVGSHILTLTEKPPEEQEAKKTGTLQGIMFAMLIAIYLFEVGNAGEITLMFSVSSFVVHSALLFSHVLIIAVAMYVLEIFTEKKWRLFVLVLLFFSGIVLLESIILRPWTLWITYPSPFLAILAFWLFYSRGFLSQQNIDFVRFMLGLTLGLFFVLIYTMAFLLLDSLLVETLPVMILLGTSIWAVIGGEE